MTERTEKALVADLVPRARRGAAFGWYNLAIGLAALPASVIFGAIWDASGAPSAFVFGATLALLAALLRLFFFFFLIIPRPPRPTLFPYTTLFRSASCSQGMGMSGASDSDMMGMAMPPIGASVSAQPNGTCCVVVPAELKSAWLPKADSPTGGLEIGRAHV